MSPIGERADPREGRVTRGKRWFESRATVVYSVIGMGMGLRFEATNLSQLMVLS